MREQHCTPLFNQPGFPQPMYWQPWHNSAWGPHHVSSQLESSHVAQDSALVLPLRLGLECHGHHLATCTYHLHLVGRVGGRQMDCQPRPRAFPAAGQGSALLPSLPPTASDSYLIDQGAIS